MNSKKLFEEIKDNIEHVVAQDSPLMRSLWQAFIAVHPVDIADFLQDLDRNKLQHLFAALPLEVKQGVFEQFSDQMKVRSIASMTDHEQIEFLHALSADELTDLFDHFSDEELKKYLNLLNKHVRRQVLSLLKFDPESAGGIMTTDAFTLLEDFTVEKCIHVLQRLRPHQEIYQQLFVVDKTHRLVGYINLEDLVFHKPKERISSFMSENNLVANAQEDRQTIAKNMVHYGLMMIPVVDSNNIFLGVISSETLVDVIVEEASETAHKMAAVGTMKYPYFESSVLRLFSERGYILIALLIAESFSSTILHAYEATLSTVLMAFIPMLISAGGNTSSQTSAIVIQGMALGEITYSNMLRFLRKEISVSFLLSLALGLTAFIRVYLTSGMLLESFTVSFTLALIIFLSGMLGSGIPLLLKRLNIDPAFSAGPFLATLMDIIGILLYCYISKMILFNHII